MKCTVCISPHRAAVIEHWAFGGSLRKTAEHFRLGYRSLHRHLDRCVEEIMAEASDRNFREDLKEQADYLLNVYRKAGRRRRKSIITKPVQFTWSRRAWGKANRKAQ